MMKKDLRIAFGQTYSHSKLSNRGILQGNIRTLVKKGDWSFLRCRYYSWLFLLSSILKVEYWQCRKSPIEWPKISDISSTSSSMQSCLRVFPFCLHLMVWSFDLTNFSNICTVPIIFFSKHETWHFGLFKSCGLTAYLSFGSWNQNY